MTQQNKRFRLIEKNSCKLYRPLSFLESTQELGRRRARPQNLSIGSFRILNFLTNLKKRFYFFLFQQESL